MMHNLEITIAPAGQARLIALAKATGRTVENIAAQVLEDFLKMTELGWIMVPPGATPEMREAALKALDNATCRGDPKARAWDAIVAYRAMVAAAPLLDDAPPEADPWIAVRDQEPDRKEPIIYARFDGRTWAVGIAYWTVSQTWNPELATSGVGGFTHWKPLGLPPSRSKS